MEGFKVFLITEQQQTSLLLHFALVIEVHFINEMFLKEGAISVVLRIQ